MRLTILTTISDRVRRLDDYTERVEYQEHKVEVGDLVWMNPDRPFDPNYRVLEVHRYIPTELHPSAEAVDLVIVAPMDIYIPKRSQWDHYKPLLAGDTRAIEVLLLSEPGVEFTINQVPKIDAPIFDYQKDKGVAREVSTGLIVERFSTFLPTSAAPYSAIYIVQPAQRCQWSSGSSEAADRIRRLKAASDGLEMLPIKKPHRIRPRQLQWYCHSFCRPMHRTRSQNKEDAMGILIQLELVSEDLDGFYCCQVPDSQNLGYAALTEIRAVATTPTVGETIEIEGETWMIANVVSYEEQFYWVTCTEDGRYPAYRLGWSHDEPMFLGVYTDLDLQPTHAEGYESCFTPKPEHIALDSNVDGNFRVREVKALKLTGDPVPWGYDTVFICRCSEASAIAAQG